MCGKLYILFHKRDVENYKEETSKLIGIYTSLYEIYERIEQIRLVIIPASNTSEINHFIQDVYNGNNTFENGIPDKFYNELDVLLGVFSEFVIIAYECDIEIPIDIFSLQNIHEQYTRPTDDKNHVVFRGSFYGMVNYTRNDYIQQCLLERSCQRGQRRFHVLPKSVTTQSSDESDGNSDESDGESDS